MSHEIFEFTYPAKIPIVYLRFKFNWASCVLPGKPIHKGCFRLLGKKIHLRQTIAQTARYIS